MPYLTRRSFATLLLGAATFTALTATSAHAAADVPCTIAALDKNGRYRTDVVVNCRVDTQTGAAQLTVKGKAKTRTYQSRTQLTSAHIDLAKRWIRRARMDTKHNPALFDMSEFLTQAANATSGFVLIRERKGKPALNIVYITDGVYRSIDLPGSDLNAKPRGMLTTGQ